MRQKRELFQQQSGALAFYLTLMLFALFGLWILMIGSDSYAQDHLHTADAPIVTSADTTPASAVIVEPLRLSPWRQENVAGRITASYTVANVQDGSMDYTFSLQDLDPAYPGNNTNRPYYLFYVTDANGKFTEYEDGTAQVQQRVVNVNGGGFLVDLRFSGRMTIAADAQSPHCEGKCPNTADWYYYTAITGTLTGLPDTRYEGALLQVAQHGPAMQVGTNAHLKKPKPTYGAMGGLMLTVIQQPTTGVILQEYSDTAGIRMTLVPLHAQGKQNTCNLYPIALPNRLLTGATPGSALGSLTAGTEPTNFGWVSWSGAPSVQELAASLLPPGNSHTYVNPNAADDAVLSIGDWVQGSPTVAAAADVHAALGELKTMTITVPVWAQVVGGGRDVRYQIVNFATVRLTDYQMLNPNQITATFLGYDAACVSSVTK